jgi:hypothetical protein
VERDQGTNVCAAETGRKVAFDEISFPITEPTPQVLKQGLSVMHWSRALFGSREERQAYNEALYRELNEHKAHWIKHGLPTAGFRCECVTLHCGARFRLSPEHWEEVRSRPNWFAVAPGHVALDLEVVVKKYPEFWLVEKRGEAEEIAEETE